MLVEIKMTKEEYHELAEVIKGLQSKEASEVFNKIFGKNHIPEIDVKINSDSLEVTIPRKTSMTFLKVLKVHTRNIGMLIKNNLNLTGLPKWIKELKSIGNDLINVFK